MSIDRFRQEYAEAAEAYQAEQDRRQAQALTLEFTQPLVQQFRRRRPRHRNGAAPMFDSQQLQIPTGDPTL